MKLNKLKWNRSKSMIINEARKNEILNKFKNAKRIIHCNGKHGPYKYIYGELNYDYLIADNDDGIRRYYDPGQWGGGVLQHEERI